MKINPRLHAKLRGMRCKAAELAIIHLSISKASVEDLGEYFNWDVAIQNPSLYSAFRVKDFLSDAMLYLAGATLFSDESRMQFGTMVKPSKFLQLVLGEQAYSTLTQAELEEFITRSKEKKATKTIEIVHGEDIRRYYHYDMHAADQGTLGSSCMRHSSNQIQLSFYVNNPQINMIVMLDNRGRVEGRALLWQEVTDASTGRGLKFMDRTYYINEQVREALFLYAADNGFYRKDSQRASNDGYAIGPTGDRIRLHHLITPVDHLKFNTFPYMDTFMVVSTSPTARYCSPMAAMSTSVWSIGQQGASSLAGYSRAVDTGYYYPRSVMTPIRRCEYVVLGDVVSWNGMYYMAKECILFENYVGERTHVPREWFKAHETEDTRRAQLACVEAGTRIFSWNDNTKYFTTVMGQRCRIGSAKERILKGFRADKDNKMYELITKQ